MYNFAILIYSLEVFTVDTGEMTGYKNISIYLRDRLLQPYIKYYIQ
jgi:hypothetical protein